MSRVPPPTIGDNELLGLVVEAEFGEGDADARARLADVLARDPGAKRRADDIYRMWDLLGTLPAPRKWTPSRTAAGIARLKFRPPRSEERRLGKECVRTCRSRGSPVH